mmetsp:Transcript_5076/g.22684  ORF Transcript_5076/g.22684 Transcript_5076/m.22684 type:complete len:393 (-) Transcript_5076:153-1331(-)
MSRLESNTWNLSAAVTSTHASSSPPDPQPDTMGSPLRGTPRSGKLPNTASSTTSPFTDLSFSVRFSVSRRSISAASAASVFAALTRSLCRSLNFAFAVASFFATAGDTRYLSTAATIVHGTASAHITIAGVSRWYGEMSTGKLNRWPLWLNRSLRCTPRMPTLTLMPTAESLPTLRVPPKSTSIAVVPARNPNLNDVFFDHRRAKNPAIPVDAGPTERSNFQLFLPFVRATPVDIPLVGPTFQFRHPLVCSSNSARSSPTANPSPPCASEYEYVRFPAVCSESCRVVASVAADWFEPRTVASSQPVCSLAATRMPSISPPAPIPRLICPCAPTYPVARSSSTDASGTSKTLLKSMPFRSNPDESFAPRLYATYRLRCAISASTRCAAENEKP